MDGRFLKGACGMNTNGIPSSIRLLVLLCVIGISSVRAQDGQAVFRFDTFGDEQLWTDVLQMQHAINDVSPAAALSVGLKVDSEALPPALINAIKTGDPSVNL